MKSILRYILILLPASIALTLSASAAESFEPDIPDSAPDTIEVIPDTTPVARQAPRVLSYVPASSPSPRPDFLTRLLMRLQQPHSDQTRSRRIDLTVAVLPNYSSESSWGLRGRLAGFYRIDRNDSLPQPSLIMGEASASIKGMFDLKFRSDMFFPDGHWRIISAIEIYRKPLNFWGINVGQTYSNPRSHYIRYTTDLKADFQYRFAGNWWIGLPFRINYTDGRHFHDSTYLLGNKTQYFAAGLGAKLVFDTRNNALNPTYGIYTDLSTIFYPRFLNSAHGSFWSTSFVIDAYKPLWRGAVGAIDIFGKMSSRSTPWTMLEMIGCDDSRMRGYYFGRYVGSSQLSGQVEIRQHVWDRFGVAVWGGAAYLHSRKSSEDSELRRHIWLPNGGFGLRFNYKYNLSARIDFGFGRKSSGVMMAIREAF